MLAVAYTGLFDTKGIEYALVILFLLALVLFWRVLDRSVEKAPGATADAPRPRGGGRWFSLPADRLYHPGHTWALPEQRGVVRVGADDFAHKLLGPPRAVRLPRVGERVRQGGPGWSFDFDGAKSIQLLAPVGGKVVERNESAVASPNRVGADPYGEGWLLKIRAPRMQLGNLLRGEAAEGWIEATQQLLRRQVSADLGLILQDGGVPVRGIARALSPDRWDSIARRFLLPFLSQSAADPRLADEGPGDES